MSPQTSAHVGPCYFKSARKVTTFIPFLQIFIGKLMSSFFKRVTRRTIDIFRDYCKSLFVFWLQRSVERANYAVAA